MKIDELNQKTALSHKAAGRTDRSEHADAQGETVARQQAAADKVELSGYKSVASASSVRQDARVNQVAEIKTQIDNGTYHVPGLAVAEKMLAKIVMHNAE
jgi:negative regulator of flagellin synthesis FlgM